MTESPTNPLPTDVASLQRMVAQLAGQVRQLQSNLSARELLIEHLQIQIAAHRRQMYGRKSEKLETEVGQLELKLEELLLDNGEDPPPAKPAVQERQPCARKPLPAALARDTVEHLPSGNGCPDCGGALKLIGEDVAEQLEYVPQSWRMIRHVRPNMLPDARAGERTITADCQRAGWPQFAGTRHDRQVCRSSAAVSSITNLRT